MRDNPFFNPFLSILCERKYLSGGLVVVQGRQGHKDLAPLPPYVVAIECHASIAMTWSFSGKGCVQRHRGIS
jgi:hypothetical protein